MGALFFFFNFFCTLGDNLITPKVILCFFGSQALCLQALICLLIFHYPVSRLQECPELQYCSLLQVHRWGVDILVNNPSPGNSQEFLTLHQFWYCVRMLFAKWKKVGMVHLSKITSVIANGLCLKCKEECNILHV